MSRFAIVTGGNRGIGEEISKKLLRKEFTVISIHKDKNKEPHTIIDDGFTPDFNYYEYICDISDPDDFILTKEKVLSDFPNLSDFGIDLIVNNAGISEACKFDGIEWCDFEIMLRTNLIAPWYCVKLFREFLKEDSSCIVNISSVSGLEGFTGHAHYCASKHGLEGLKKVLAKELAPIRVNNIAPSPTYTDMFIALDKQYSKINGWEVNPEKEEMIKKYEGKMLIKRFAEPEEIAEAVWFVYKNKYITGVTIPVAGGNILR